MHLERLFVPHGVVEALTASHSPVCQIRATSPCSVPTSGSPQHQYYPPLSLATRSAQALLTASALDGRGVCKYFRRSNSREE